jgi:hypothetical protein
MLWTELCPFQSAYVEFLTPNVILFGDRVLMRQLSLNEVLRVKPLIHYDWCPFKKRKRHQGCVHIEKKAFEYTVSQGRGASEETIPAGTLILDF